MLFSAFTPLDLYRLSAETPRAQLHYEAMVANHGGQYDMTAGSRQEAFCFAGALQVARVEQRMREAARQNFADEVCEFMPVREAEYGLIPGPTDTMPTRRAAFRRAKKLHTTWTRTEIEEALKELLGSDFLAYRPTPLADVERWPASLGAAPQNLAATNVTRKVVRITQAVSAGLGSPQTVTYRMFDPTLGAVIDTAAAGAAGGLAVGDKFVVEPNVSGISETVTVAAVFQAFGAVPIGQLPVTSFTATFQKPHTNGCLCFTHAFPRWISTKRHSLIVVTAAAAIDADKRRLVDRQMRRMVRASSTWDIVQSANGTTTGAFTIGSPSIGMQTIGSITI